MLLKNFIFAENKKLNIQEQIVFAVFSMIGSIISYFTLIIYPPSKNGENSSNTLSKRLGRWKQIINADKRTLICDIFFSCVLISVVYTIFILEVISYKQALLGGLTAEACMYSYIHNARNNI